MEENSAQIQEPLSPVLNRQRFRRRSVAQKKKQPANAEGNSKNGEKRSSSIPVPIDQKGSPLLKKSIPSEECNGSPRREAIVLQGSSKQEEPRVKERPCFIIGEEISMVCEKTDYLMEPRCAKTCSSDSVESPRNRLDVDVNTRPKLSQLNKSQLNYNIHTDESNFTLEEQIDDLGKKLGDIKNKEILPNVKKCLDGVFEDSCEDVVNGGNSKDVINVNISESVFNTLTGIDCPRSVDNFLGFSDSDIESAIDEMEKYKLFLRMFTSGLKGSDLESHESALSLGDSPSSKKSYMNVEACEGKRATGVKRTRKDSWNDDDAKRRGFKQKGVEDKTLCGLKRAIEKMKTRLENELSEDEEIGSTVSDSRGVVECTRKKQNKEDLKNSEKHKDGNVFHSQQNLLKHKKKEENLLESYKKYSEEQLAVLRNKEQNSPRKTSKQELDNGTPSSKLKLSPLRNKNENNLLPSQSKHKKEISNSPRKSSIGSNSSRKDRKSLRKSPKSIDSKSFENEKDKNNTEVSLPVKGAENPNLITLPSSNGVQICIGNNRIKINIRTTEGERKTNDEDLRAIERGNNLQIDDFDSSNCAMSGDVNMEELNLTSQKLKGGLNIDELNPSSPKFKGGSNVNELNLSNQKLQGGFNVNESNSSSQKLKLNLNINELNSSSQKFKGGLNVNELISSSQKFKGGLNVNELNSSSQKFKGGLNVNELNSSSQKLEGSLNVFELNSSQKFKGGLNVNELNLSQKGGLNVNELNSSNQKFEDNPNKLEKCKGEDFASKPDEENNPREKSSNICNDFLNDTFYIPSQFLNDEDLENLACKSSPKKNINEKLKDDGNVGPSIDSAMIVDEIKVFEATGKRELNSQATSRKNDEKADKKSENYSNFKFKMPSRIADYNKNKSSMSKLTPEKFEALRNQTKAMNKLDKISPLQFNHGLTSTTSTDLNLEAGSNDLKNVAGGSSLQWRKPLRPKSLLKPRPEYGRPTYMQSGSRKSLNFHSEPNPSCSGDAGFNVAEITTGFTLASGSKVEVPKEKLERAMNIFVGIEKDVSALIDAADGKENHSVNTNEQRGNEIKIQNDPRDSQIDIRRFNECDNRSKSNFDENQSKLNENQLNFNQTGFYNNSQSNENQNTGFTLASGKSVGISQEQLRRAKMIFGDDLDLKEEFTFGASKLKKANSFKNTAVKTSKQYLSEVCNDLKRNKAGASNENFPVYNGKQNNLDLANSKEAKSIGCQMGRDDNIEFNFSAGHKRSNQGETIEFSKVSQKLKEDANVGFSFASSTKRINEDNKLENSPFDFNSSKKLFKNDFQANNQACGFGFSLASGKKVEFSKDQLKKALNVFGDDLKLSEPLEDDYNKELAEFKISFSQENKQTFDSIEKCKQISKDEIKKNPYLNIKDGFSDYKLSSDNENKGFGGYKLNSDNENKGFGGYKLNIPKENDDFSNYKSIIPKEKGGFGNLKTNIAKVNDGFSNFKLNAKENDGFNNHKLNVANDGLKTGFEKINTKSFGEQNELNCENFDGNGFSAGFGFTSAAGKKVEISKDRLQNALKIFGDDLILNNEQFQIQPASFKNPSTSQQIPKEFGDFKCDANYTDESPGISPVVIKTKFSDDQKTGNSEQTKSTGNTVLTKSRNPSVLGKPLSVDSGFSSSEQNERAEKSNFLSASGKSYEDPKKAFDFYSGDLNAGFSLASGKAVDITKDKIAKAMNLFKDIDNDLEELEKSFETDLNENDFKKIENNELAKQRKSLKDNHTKKELFPDIYEEGFNENFFAEQFSQEIRKKNNIDEEIKSVKNNKSLFQEKNLNNRNDEIIQNKTTADIETERHKQTNSTFKEMISNYNQQNWNKSNNDQPNENSNKTVPEILQDAVSTYDSVLEKYSLPKTGFTPDGKPYKKQLGMLGRNKMINISKQGLERGREVFKDIDLNFGSSPVRSSGVPQCSTPKLKGSARPMESFNLTPIKVSGNAQNYEGDSTIIFHEKSCGDFKQLQSEIDKEYEGIKRKLIVLEERKNELEQQKFLIENGTNAHKRQKIGVLLENKLKCVERVPLKNLFNSGDESVDYFNIPQYIFDVTPKNAEDVHFNVASGSECLSVIKTSDGAVLIPSSSNIVGVTEIDNAFRAMVGVDPKLLHHNWVQNHYKWIVWKLASYERKFPQYFKNCLSLENVMEQLKYRYDIEIDRAKRSALRRIFEKDDVPQKRMVLCVSDIIQQFGNKLELELTDGWYSVRTVIDQPLSQQIYKNKIKVGTKLMIQGADLMNCEHGAHPLDAGDSVRLKINFNGTRRTHWYMKLGYYKFAAPFPICMSSLSPEGGPVSFIKIYIARAYPLKYIEKLNNAKIWRNSKAEEKRATDFESDRMKQIEIIKERACREYQIENHESIYNSNVPNIAKADISKVTCPKTLYNLIQRSGDPESLIELLTSTQQRIVMEYKQNLNNQKQHEISMRINKQIEDLKINKRDVSAVLTLLVMDACEGNDKYYTFSVWKPTEDHLQMLKENSSFCVYNVTFGKMGELYSSNRTYFRQNNEHIKLKKPERQILPIAMTVDNYYKPLFGEFDTIGLIVQMHIENHQQDLWIADFNGRLLYVKIVNGPSLCSLLDNLKRGQTVAISNLIKKHSKGEFGIALANLCTVISQYPSQKYLQKGMEMFNEQLPKDLSKLLTDCDAKIEHNRKDVNVSIVQNSYSMNSTCHDTDDSMEDNTTIPSRTTMTDVAMSLIDTDQFV